MNHNLLFSASFSRTYTHFVLGTAWRDPRQRRPRLCAHQWAHSCRETRTRCCLAKRICSGRYGTVRAALSLAARWAGGLELGRTELATRILSAAITAAHALATPKGPALVFGAPNAPSGWRRRSAVHSASSHTSVVPRSLRCTPPPAKNPHLAVSDDGAYVIALSEASGWLWGAAHGLVCRLNR